jgi:hypothetical protein
MLSTEDIKNLTEYQLEVFKDVFLTKEDGQKMDVKIDRVQNSLDAVLKEKQTRDAEVIVLNHRIKKTEDWIDKAAPKLDIKFEH